MLKFSFRPYCNSDLDACLNIFDANCPESFASNERAEYEDFLKSVEHGYEVCVMNIRVCGAFGLFEENSNSMRVRWILLDPKSHGAGIGSMMMNRLVQLACEKKASTLMISASQKSSPFFARFGAVEIKTVRDGWGIGMHRVDMELSLDTD